MDSFAQQMLDEIDRRCTEYHLSNTIIRLDNESNERKNSDESESIPKNKVEKEVNDIEKDSPSIELKEDIKTEMVYANSNVMKFSKVISNTSKSISIPLGRKPALPPKPPKRLELKNIKPKGVVHDACASVFDRKSPPSIKDPAEMSLKERLALFEKKTLIPKTAQGISTNPKNSEDLNMAPLITSSLNPEKKLKTVSSKTYADGSDDIYKTVYELIECCDKQDDSKGETIPKISRQLDNVIASSKRNEPPKSHPPPPPPNKLNLTRAATSNPCSNIKENELNVEVKCSPNNRRRSGEMIIGSEIQTLCTGSEIARIVTTIAPTKMKPEETIGLNDLHQSGPNCTLLSETNQYEEDSWDKFIECLLFFCCVA